jgi:hypothetical protein
MSRLQQYSQFLIPTFFRSRKQQYDSLGVEEETLPITRRDTDYLDGLRGFAALAVCVEHYFIQVYPLLYL